MALQFHWFRVFNYPDQTLHIFPTLKGSTSTATETTVLLWSNSNKKGTHKKEKGDAMIACQWSFITPTKCAISKTSSVTSVGNDWILSKINKYKHIFWNASPQKLSCSQRCSYSKVCPPVQAPERFNPSLLVKGMKLFVKGPNTVQYILAYSGLLYLEHRSIIIIIII